MGTATWLLQENRDATVPANVQALLHERAHSVLETGLSTMTTCLQMLCNC